MQVQKSNLQIPDPVYYGPIFFYDGDRKIQYTDCWQISLLRFLHLIFGDKQSISYQMLTRYMNLDDKNCISLIDYFKQNPTYHNSQSFYTTEQGYEIRSKWCQFLNKTGLLMLKKQQKYEVCATIPNLLSFFKGFFPKLDIDTEIQDQTIENLESKQQFQHYEQILNKIYKQLSINHNIHIKIKANVSANDWLFFSIIQNIFVNEIHLIDWEIYECYTIKDGKIGQRQGGHSDYRYK